MRIRTRTFFDDVMQLEQIRHILTDRLKSCDLCPNQCHCDRTEGQTGLCRNTAEPSIYQHFMHHGEEISIVPAFVINMAGCTLACPSCPERCRFGRKKIPAGPPRHYAQMLAAYFTKREMPKSIEWIGGEPSAQLLYVLETTAELKNILPQCPPVYLNTNAYFDPGLVGLMENIIDAFVFDYKCTDRCAKIVGGFERYEETVTAVISKAAGMIKGPHILRHLVMPGHVACCTKPIVEWCKKNIPGVTFTLMTTVHDFRPDAPVFELPQADAEQSVLLARSAGLRSLLVNGNP